jgi:hypothetical protein
VSHYFKIDLKGLSKYGRKKSIVFVQFLLWTLVSIFQRHSFWCFESVMIDPWKLIFRWLKLGVVKFWKDPPNLWSLNGTPI